MSCALIIPEAPTLGVVAQEWFTAAEVAEMALPGLPKTKRGVQDLATREGWGQVTDERGMALSRPRRARGGGVEYHLSLLPEVAKARLLTRTAPARLTSPEPASSRESVWARYDRLPATMKAKAKLRLEIIQRVESLMRAGLGKARACEEVTAQAAREARAAGEKSFALSALYAWFSRINGVSSADRLAYLAPDYVGRTATAACSDEAWLQFRSEYLTNSQQSAAAAHAKIAMIGVEHGWSVPSAKTLLNRIHREVDPITLVYLREGEPGLERKFPTPRRDISDMTVLQCVNVDGHEVDVMVEWADGTIGRPMMIGIQDLYSRRMLVTLIGRSESSDLIRRAFAILFEQHGIPDDVIFDNGRAFASKWLTGGNPTRYRFTIRPEDPIGLLGQLGCRVHFTNPYSGRSKPIERGFRDFCDGFARSAIFKGAYTGNSVANKPADYGSRAAPYEDFARELEFYVQLHNARPGRRTQSARGILSFDQVWTENLERGALIKRPTREQLRLALLAAEGVTVRRQTAQIHMGGNIYFNEALWRHEGEKVEFAEGDDDGLISFALGEEFRPLVWLARSLGRVMRRHRDQIIAEDGVEAADKQMPEYEIESAIEAATRLDQAIERPGPRFSEGEPSAEDTARTAELDQREADIAARERAAAARDAETATAQAAAERTARQAEDAAFAEGLVAAGRLPDGHTSLILGFCDALGSAEMIAFAEGEEAQDPRQAFKAYLTKNLGVAIRFDEIAGGDGLKFAEGPSLDDLTAAIEAEMASAAAAGTPISAAEASRRAKARR